MGQVTGAAKKGVCVGVGVDVAVGDGVPDGVGVGVCEVQPGPDPMRGVAQYSLPEL
jgi:hypothetical protein